MPSCKKKKKQHQNKPLSPHSPIHTPFPIQLYRMPIGKRPCPKLTQQSYPEIASCLCHDRLLHRANSFMEGIITCQVPRLCPSPRDCFLFRVHKQILWARTGVRKAYSPVIQPSKGVRSSVFPSLCQTPYHFPCKAEPFDFSGTSKFF